MELGGIAIWDGERALGTGTIRWGGGPDAAIESVDAEGPAAESAASERRLSVIPGLIDTHVHLAGYAGTGRVDFLSWPLVTRPEERTLHALAQARRALVAGVTTVRDLSADELQFSLARAIDDGVVEGPRVLAHGMVGMTGGHADLFTPRDFPLRGPVADGADACRALVRRWARAGADGIKIATSGGVLSVGDRAAWRNHTPEEIAAIVDEAHALGMPVAAHAHTEDGIRTALDHGVDSIEHGTLISADLARRVVAAGVTIAPTLLINEAVAAGGAGASPEQAAKAAELVARRDELLRGAADAGVDLLLGTDANGAHVAFGDEHRELARMAEVLGWSAERVLRAATSRAAAAIRRPDLGRLAPGSAADLVVVRGRPWEDLGALDPASIVAVVSRGRVVAGALPPQASSPA